MDKYSYKIVEATEDHLDTTIEKSNVTVKFTLREVLSEEKQISKMIKELEGKLMYENARKTNIENNHAYVKELSDEQRFSVHMYEEACSFVRAIEPKLKELKDGLVESHEEITEVYKQTGMQIPVAALANIEAPKTEENNEQKESQEKIS